MDNFFNLKEMYNLKIERIMKTILEWLIQFAIGIILPVAPYLMLISGLVFCDTIIGAMAAKKKGESPTWKGLIPAMQKIIYGCLALLCVFHVERTFGISDAAMTTKVLASIFSYWILHNIDKNGQVLFGISFFDQIKSHFGKNVRRMQKRL